LHGVPTGLTRFCKASVASDVERRITSWLSFAHLHLYNRNVLVTMCKNHFCMQPFAQEVS